MSERISHHAQGCALLGTHEYQCFDADGKPIERRVGNEQIRSGYYCVSHVPLAASEWHPDQRRGASQNGYDCVCSPGGAPDARDPEHSAVCETHNRPALPSSVIAQSKSEYKRLSSLGANVELRDDLQASSVDHNVGSDKMVDGKGSENMGASSVDRQASIVRMARHAEALGDYDKFVPPPSSVESAAPKENSMSTKDIKPMPWDERIVDSSIPFEHLCDDCGQPIREGSMHIRHGELSAAPDAYPCDPAYFHAACSVADPHPSDCGCFECEVWNTASDEQRVADLIVDCHRHLVLQQRNRRGILPASSSVSKLVEALRKCEEFFNRQCGWDKARAMQAMCEEALKPYSLDGNAKGEV